MWGIYNGIYNHLDIGEGEDTILASGHRGDIGEGEDTILASGHRGDIGEGEDTILASGHRGRGRCERYDTRRTRLRFYRPETDR